MSKTGRRRQCEYFYERNARKLAEKLTADGHTVSVEHSDERWIVFTEGYE